MSKNAYVGVSGVARRVSDMCIGVSNVARKVVTGYVGVNDVARQFYPQATTPTPDPEPDYPYNTSISIAASKCITENYSTLNRTNMDICYVGRAVLNYDEDSRAGAALKFNAPAAGWGYYGKAELYFYRNGGSASAAVRVGKLNYSYDTALGWTDFYYGRLDAAQMNRDYSGAPNWCMMDISSFLPSGKGELGITLMSKNAYITIDGNPYSPTAPYIQLSR